MMEVGSGNDGAIQEVAGDPDGAPANVQPGRKEERFAVTGHAEVIFNHGASLFRGRIVNISNSGCFVQMSARVGLPPGTPVEIMASVNATVIRLTAETRFSQPKVGIGLRFVHMTKDMREKLSDLIATLNTGAEDTAPSPPRVWQDAAKQ